MRIRFHLARGENYKNWQVIDYPKISYYNPFEHNLILKDCVLKNQRKTAEKIFNGANKTVCSWIVFKELTTVINSNFDKKKYKKIFYNPKKNPYWTDDEGNAIDNSRFKEIRSINKELYALI